MTERSQLQLEIIWTDEQLVELQAIASNGRYCGTTEVYTTIEDLLRLAEQLEGFPKQLADVVAFEAGDQNSYAFLRLIFYCIDGVGHTAINVCMEESVETNFRAEKKHQVSFELRCEPSAIDKFQKELKLLAVSQKGRATLLQSW
ncbi:MAG: hypothetical protein ICV68_04985 [Pyrinomonadaceae bacterium]|nr:hypothetical protein [Pyrinomonadaceae bacterium]